jgi:hypothetical protein
MDSSRFVETEFVTTDDGNARICNLQINFPHTWNSSDMTDGSSDKEYEGRNRKGTVINSVGRKLVPAVFERNVIRILNSKYGENERMEVTSGNRIKKKKDFALMSEGTY